MGSSSSIAGGTSRGDDVDSLLGDAAALESAGLFAEAIRRTWEALDLAAGDPRAKRCVVRLLREHPLCIPEERRTDLQRLLVDPEVGPEEVAPAGWALVPLGRSDTAGAELQDSASALEKDSLALTLLAETYVSILPVELALTQIRRWLLLAGNREQYPSLCAALVAQARLNGGAWLFDQDEREAVAQLRTDSFVEAYFPSPPPAPPDLRFHDKTVQAVANQYSRWPYPPWSRITRPRATTLPRIVEKLDGGRPCALAADAEVLVAGCGTGWEAAYFAERLPDARITAIDVSSSSLAFAADRCDGLNIDFRLLDLHQVASLGRKFDLIICSGVLHHLSDPEAGWAKLVEVLNPGGVMKLMLYSRAGRLRVEAAKAQIADLRQRTVDDDLLRSARRRLIDKAPQLVEGFYDFYALAGVHDFLFNCHEDSFDVPRIARALDHLKLDLLAFMLPTASEEARYRADHPDDPLFRDVRAWAALEKKNPFLFSGMYEFWCRSAG